MSTAIMGQVLQTRTCQPHALGGRTSVIQQNGMISSRTGSFRNMNQILSPAKRERLVAAKSGLVEHMVQHHQMVLGALEVDWSDPDVQIGALGAFLGIAMGIGVPIFYISRDERDEERLEELRALNRATKEATGEYMTDEEINEIRPARWTDRREFVDDD